MFDRITQLVFACAFLSITFGVMQITLGTEYENYSKTDQDKCEVASAWIDRWTKSDGDPRYYDIEMGTARPDWFGTCQDHTCNVDLSQQRYALPRHKCGLETPGVVDTERPEGYINRKEMVADENLLNLGVHFVDISNDGTSANLFVSRYVVPSAFPQLGCATGIYQSVSAKKTESGWTFYE